MKFADIAGLTRQDNLQVKSDAEFSLEKIFKAGSDAVKNELYNQLIGDHVEDLKTEKTAEIEDEILKKYVPLFIIGAILLFIFFKKGMI